ncbi:DoxX family protein [Streptomyces sp. NPDC048277]|uniref:DoxX family protein n=1 Tax=Streptomyces sp. NPDC048277 TaxID=3155027 RepID=UPI0033E861CF
MGDDLGMLVIRLAVGLMLITHGANKVAGPGGIGGTTAWFAALGFRPAWMHARVAAATEIAVGVLLGLGLLTGLACAGCVGLMLVAALTDHRGKGYFIFKGGWEYVLLVALVAIGAASVGPGAWSLDHAFGLDLAGAWWALVAVAIGTGAAFGLLAAGYRPAAVSGGESD